MYRYSSDLGIPFIYWSLRILLLAVLCYSGYRIANTSGKKSRPYVISAIASYALIQGLRWGRGADYFHYLLDIEFDLKGMVCTPDPEFLYEQWCHFYHSLPLPSWTVFIIYSGLFMGSFVKLLQSFPKTAVWALPVFVLMTPNSETLIRQYFATCFVIFAYAFYLQGNNKYFWLSLAIVPFIHTSGLFACMLLIAFRYVPIGLKSPIPLIAIYVLLMFAWDSSYLSSFATWLSALNFGDMKGASYAEHADFWFTDEGSLSFRKNGKIAAGASLLYLSVSFLFYLIVIWKGFLLQLKDRRLQIAYYFSYISILIMIIAGDIEIIKRFTEWTCYFIPLIIGYILYDTKKTQKNSYLIYSVFFIFLAFYKVINLIGKPFEFGCGFIWDS